METLHIAICEDDPTEAEKLLMLLHQSPTPTDYKIFTIGEALLEIYQPDTFDLLLMDIYMGGMTGIDAAAKIREIDEAISIAFITTSTEFTLESYRLSALKYIEKPLKQKDIDDILLLALLKKGTAPSLIIQRNRNIEKIPFSRIVYLEQQRHQVHIYLKDQSVIRIYGKLSDLSLQLEEQSFFNSHKSYCVNLAFVRMIDSELRCFVMQNGQNVPIRREGMGKAKKAYEDFLFHKTRKRLQVPGN